ncbi:iron export ABC transporter permease subunit FetB [Kroppenstedtia pulmonis]|uniref:Iron export ABC transporter permease subunit FetB n=1 Tax=Kroppenstedtia pulmonis TaxID=1380685 RepID=A0A7D4BH38_9BACL|nr:iron export ABC transporter permease subunit FetB [Kroppenstedtia pulmonis]QKG85552.1 iron export ABC transporter permease subunit FetB [Kroppenstedtia pulmonis]
MSTLATIATVCFVLIAMGVSLWQKLNLEKDLIIATLRAGIQLTLVGYVLQFIFEVNSWIYILLIITVAVSVAAGNAASRGKGIPYIYLRVLLTISVVTGLTLSGMLGLGMIEAKASMLIPISGMVIGNSMVVSSLLLSRMKENAISMREEILVSLSLGASYKQASRKMVKQAVKAGMIPIIDSTKTVGLVQLPGMMTGLIIAGTPPLEAVRYQLLIMFSFTASAALVSMILAFLVYPTLFNKEHQYRGWKDS